MDTFFLFSILTLYCEFFFFLVYFYFLGNLRIFMGEENLIYQSNFLHIYIHTHSFFLKKKNSW